MAGEKGRRVIKNDEQLLKALSLHLQKDKRALKGFMKDPYKFLMAHEDYQTFSESSLKKVVGGFKTGKEFIARINAHAEVMW